MICVPEYTTKLNPKRRRPLSLSLFFCSLFVLITKRERDNKTTSFHRLVAIKTAAFDQTTTEKRQHRSPTGDGGDDDDDESSVVALEDAKG